jgi:hypothetical protein
MTAVKMAFGYGHPRSSNVGWRCSLTFYSAEATKPQTVAVSQMWLAASSGLRDAAVVGRAQRPNTAMAADNVLALIVNPQATLLGAGDDRQRADGAGGRDAGVLGLSQTIRLPPSPVNAVHYLAAARHCICAAIGLDHRLNRSTTYRRLKPPICAPRAPNP